MIALVGSSGATLYKNKIRQMQVRGGGALGDRRRDYQDAKARLTEPAVLNYERPQPAHSHALMVTVGAFSIHCDALRLACSIFHQLRL